MKLEPYCELGFIRKHQCTFDSFRNMWQRLQQKSSVGRYVGVQVCPTWVSFKKFYQDMGERPEGMTLDRKDGSLGYHKDNCKWSDPYEQQRNRKNSIWVSDGVDTLVLKDMAIKYQLDYKTIHYRTRIAGWNVDEALCTPIGAKGTNGSIIRISSGNFKLATTAEIEEAKRGIRAAKKAKLPRS